MLPTYLTNIVSDLLSMFHSFDNNVIAFKPKGEGKGVGVVHRAGVPAPPRLGSTCLPNPGEIRPGLYLPVMTVCTWFSHSYLTFVGSEISRHE